MGVAMPVTVKIKIIHVNITAAAGGKTPSSAKKNAKTTYPSRYTRFVLSLASIMAPNKNAYSAMEISVTSQAYLLINKRSVNTT